MPNARIDWSFAWPEQVFGVKPARDESHPACCGTLESPNAGVGLYADRLSRELPDLPFLALPYAEELTRQLDIHTEFLQSFQHMLVLGIGGSALGARALQKSFFPQQDRPGHSGRWLWIADNIDPDSFQAHLDALPPTETLVVVISKSGGTIETVAQYFLVLPWLQKSLPGTWKEHLFMVTDAQQGFLRDEVDKYFLRSLPVPENLGGRFSVLSAVGLVPAAFMGIDWKELLRGAMQLGRPLAQNSGLLAEHPAWKLAVWASHLTFAQLSQLVFFSYVPAWSAFGPWFAQLWAESLGKNGRGSMPLPAVGVTDQHSLLQMFLDGPRDKGCLFVSSAPTEKLALQPDLAQPWDWLGSVSMGSILDAETLATRMSLTQRHVPLVHLNVPDASEYSAGGMLMLLQATTVLTGWLLDINPIDQPAVEEGKLLARAQLGAPGSEADVARLKAFTDSQWKDEQVLW